MKFEINSFEDLKAVAVLKKIKISSELPEMLGYKSRWGLKMAMDNQKKREEIIEKAKKIFEI